MPSSFSLRHLSALVASVLAGCTSGVADDRPLLETCEVGLYYADCGGVGDPVIGCDRDSGACRWFAGGTVARNHEVSTCPVEDVCCHAAPSTATPWAFEEWMPASSAALARTQSDLGVLRSIASPVSASFPAAPIVVTLSPTPAPAMPTTVCDLSPEDMPVLRPLCRSGTLMETAMVGDALVLRFDYSGSGMLAVEILPEGEGHVARIFTTQDGTDVLRGPLCLGNIGGGALEATGALVLDPDSFASPGNAHGVLELDVGASHITIQF